LRRPAEPGLLSDHGHCNFVRERTGLRVFRIEANHNSLLCYAAVDFDFSGTAARAFWIVTKQNSKHTEQSAFKKNRFGRLLSRVVGALCRFHTCHQIMT
jgi:hypothetical protein